MVLSRFANMIINADRKKNKKELYEIEKKKNLSDKKKEEIYDYLVKLVKTLDKKENYKYHDRDNLDYYGIKEIENLFDDDDADDNYDKSILVKSYFKNNYKYYQNRGDKEKNLLVKQYLYKIIPYLSDIINDHKAKNESNEWKIEVNMHANFISSKDTGEPVLYMYRVITKKLHSVMK